MDTKAWYQSKAIWGSVVAILAMIGGAVFKLNIDADTQAQMVDILVTLGGAGGAAFAIYGRVKAQHVITPGGNSTP